MVMQRDPNDWLRRFSPAEWIRAGLAEVRRAEQAYARHDGRGGLAGCKRAAGMALNGILWFEEKDEWGRSYVDHLHGLANDADAPEAVREACAKLLGAPAPSGASTAQGPLVMLRSPRQDQSVIEATKDIVAHAYAVVQRHGGGELP